MTRHEEIRQVSPGLYIRAMFGGFNNQFGWAFFGFGMIFFWVFGSLVSLDDILPNSGKLLNTTGMVVEVNDTNATENDERVHRISFAFVRPGSSATLPAEAIPTAEMTANPEFIFAECYQTGTDLQPGQLAEVEFPESKPEKARISGTRRSVFPAWVMVFVSIFPFIGLIFMFFGIRRGLLIVGLLNHSCLTYGVLINKEPTNTRINDEPVMKLTFSFETQTGRSGTVEAYTHEYQHLVDEAEEPLLYNPVNPKEACMLDDIPGRPRLDKCKRLVAQDGEGFLKTLLVPTIAIAINIIGAVASFISINR
ncbi:MAG: hypothetical protein ACOYXC_07540 [Candidatus Rifleibacteriota bacterium]